VATVEIVPNSGNAYGTAWAGTYQSVDEGSGAIDTSDFISTGVNGRKEFFDWTTDSAFSGASISQIEFFYHSKKTSSGAFIPQLYIGGTAYSGTTPTLTTSYATYSTVWTTNPADSAAWESTDINDIVAGFINSNPRGINLTFVATTWIIVTYTVAGYGNEVIGVASANIGSINGIATANISKVNGV